MRILLKDFLWTIVWFYGGLILLLLLVMEGIYWYHQHQTEDTVITAIIDSGLSDPNGLFDGKTRYPFNVLTFSRDVTDTDGHGTHIAGIVSRLSPETDIMPIKLIGDKKESLFSTTSFAVLYSVLFGADVVNMSFSHEKEPLADLAVWYGQKKGVIFVAATGNEGKETMRYPAAIDDVLSVAAVDKNEVLFPLSNIGEATVFAAPGVNVLSANALATGESDKEVRKSGTSMSAAYLSGVISYLLEQNPDLTQADIEDELLRMSVSVAEEENRSTGKLHAVQYDKLIAHHQQKLYLNIRAQKKKTDEETATVYVDAYGADSIHVHSYPFQQDVWVDGRGEKAVEVPLEEGYNRINASIHTENHGKVEQINILRDTSPPAFDYQGTYDVHGEVRHLLVIADYGMHSIEADSQSVMEEWNDLVLMYEDEKKREVRLLELPATNRDITIRATDSLGHTSETVLPALPKP